MVIYCNSEDISHFHCERKPRQIHLEDFFLEISLYLNPKANNSGIFLEESENSESLEERALSDR